MMMQVTENHRELDIAMVCTRTGAEKLVRLHMTSVAHFTDMDQR